MQHHEPGRNVHAEKEKDEARRVKNDEEKKKDLFRMEINFPFTKRERDDANERIFPIKLNQSGRERFFVWVLEESACCTLRVPGNDVHTHLTMSNMN